MVQCLHDFRNMVDDAAVGKRRDDQPEPDHRDAQEDKKGDQLFLILSHRKVSSFLSAHHRPLQSDHPGSQSSCSFPSACLSDQKGPQRSVFFRHHQSAECSYLCCSLAFSISFTYRPRSIFLTTAR